MCDVENESDHGHNERPQSYYLMVIRYISVGVVSLALFIMMLLSFQDDDIWIFFVILGVVVGFYITIPLIAFYLYSFVCSLFRKTKNDRRLLYFHLADVLMAGVIVGMIFHPGRRCNAEIMARHYEEYGNRMRTLVGEVRAELTDSTDLMVEFGSGAPAYNDLPLNDKELDKLRSQLKRVGCIGIEIDNYDDRDFTCLRFRRVGMGLYSFQLYDRLLTQEQKDSLNNDGCYIVLNDSTVLEYGGGVFGPQYFGKDEKRELLERLSRKRNVH